MNPDQAHFLGVDFDRRDMAATEAWLADRPADAPFAFVITPNVDHVVKLDRAPRDAEIRTAYALAALRLCDSRIVATLARTRGVDLPVVPGSDLTAYLFQQIAKPGDRICLIGGDAPMLAELRALRPDLDIVQHIPPMGMLKNPAAMTAAAAFVRNAKARFTLLAVAMPQQEILALRVAQAGGASGIGLCIGASLDFLTGRKARAPLWMRRASLEWLHRLLSEPKRLWRRYLIEGPRVFLLTMRWRRP
ncbi:MAG TPA: WecB/TagA/CpsF family glycosyltransferase [Sphingomonas sp.]|uniref:WecB/TagA/CpsF family glycosyltransferase n=1 Tax=Sphingomonas sp. TaxID=28214 RepID=UPI002CC2C863|nr:WecB/TagA/CpsF family glycosyltransferase [Sphingomonas sp.]HMI18183.1 WecB/TagA/CpsF family glycosyltransferase [Sphingomonas sp.]